MFHFELPQLLYAEIADEHPPAEFRVNCENFVTDAVKLTLPGSSLTKARIDVPRWDKDTGQPSVVVREFLS